MMRAQSGDTRSNGLAHQSPERLSHRRGRDLGTYPDGHRLDGTGRGKAQGLIEAPAPGLVAPVEEERDEIGY